MSPLVPALALTFCAFFCLALAVTTTRQRSRARARLVAAVARPSRNRPPQGGRGRGLLGSAGARLAGIPTVARRLDRLVESAGYALRPEEFAGLLAGAALAGASAGLLLAGPVGALALGAAAGSVPWLAARLAAHRRTWRLHGQLPDALAVIASSLRAGHSFLQSLDMVAAELPDPAASEFSRLVAEVRLGRPVEEALDALATRVDSPDFTWAMVAVRIQRETGGNLAEILDTVATTLREREVVRRQVRALSAEGRLSMYVLGGLPFVVAAWLTLTNPDYLGLLVSTQVGRVMLVCAVGLMALGVIWMRKLVKIDA